MEEVSYIRFVFALGFVIGLIGLTAVIFKKFALDRKFMGQGGKRRLSLQEILAVDGKRRLVLIKRDSQEHLLLIGGSTDIVIETNIQQKSDESNAPSA